MKLKRNLSKRANDRSPILYVARFYLSLASECSKCAAKMEQLSQIGFTVPCFQHISLDFLNNDLGNECTYN